MEVKGTLDTMPLPELIRWLHDSKQSGTLVFQIGPVRKKLYFRDGDIVSASSSNPREFLGQFLLRKGWMSEGQLIKAVEEQLESGKMLGEILLAKGWLTPEQLERALKEKATDTIYSLFICDTASFEFHAGELPPPNIPPIEMSVDAILMEGAVRHDEWKHIKEILPGLERTVLERVEGAIIGREQRRDMIAYRVYRSVDGRKTLGEVAMELYQSDYEVFRAAARLHDAGLVQVARVMEVQDPSQAAIPKEMLLEACQKRLEEGQVEEARNLLFFIQQHYPDEGGEITHLQSAIGQKLITSLRSQIPSQAIPEIKKSLDDLMNIRLDPMQGFLLTRINGIYDVATLRKLVPIPEEQFYLIMKQLLDMDIVTLKAT